MGLAAGARGPGPREETPPQILDSTLPFLSLSLVLSLFMFLFSLMRYFSLTCISHCLFLLFLSLILSRVFFHFLSFFPILSRVLSLSKLNLSLSPPLSLSCCASPANYPGFESSLHHTLFLEPWASDCTPVSLFSNHKTRLTVMPHFPGGFKEVIQRKAQGARCIVGLR